MSKLNGLNLSDADFWNFSISVYQKPNVQSILLQGQAQLHANVNLALLCLWMTQQGVQLSQTQLEHLHKTVTSFGVEFTQVIRKARNDFKLKQESLDNYAEVRTHLLDAELLMERQEQSILVDEVSRLTLSTECNAVSNIENYQSFLMPNIDDISAVDTEFCDLNQYIS